MTDIILSSFLSLFALFGKEEQVDEAWAKAMLENYLRHHFGIRNIDEYLDLYTKMRSAYEMFGDVDAKDTVRNICSNLHGKISSDMEAFLLLRLMEFCGSKKYNKSAIFVIMAKIFQIPKEQFQDFEDFVNNRESNHVLKLHLENTNGRLKTLLDPVTNSLLFTYMGTDNVRLNDVPVLPGTYQIWQKSSVIKGKSGHPVYFSSILKTYAAINGKQIPCIQ